MDGCTVVQTGAWCQRVGLEEIRLREKILLIAFDGTETAWGDGREELHSWEHSWRKHTALEVRFNCWVAHKGQSHCCGLFSHTSAPGFWGTGKDSQKREHVRLICSLLISLLPHARPSPHVPWSPLLGPLTQIWKHAPHSCRAGDKIKAEPQGLWH